jgi:hypothetical protein
LARRRVAERQLPVAAAPNVAGPETAELTSNAGTCGTYLSRLRSNDLVSIAGSVVRIANGLYG